MKRTEKEAVVQSVADRLGRATAVVLTNFQGLKVDQMTTLRAQLREKDYEYLVVKNTLLKRAADGGAAEPLTEDLVGPNGVAFSFGDPVELAKTLAQFAKDNPKFEIRSGLLEGQIIDKDGVEQLSKLPGREQLLGMLLGAMNGVPRNLVSVLAAVPRSLLNVLKAIEEQKAEAA